MWREACEAGSSLKAGGQPINHGSGERASASLTPHPRREMLQDGGRRRNEDANREEEQKNPSILGVVMTGNSWVKYLHLRNFPVWSLLILYCCFKLHKDASNFHRSNAAAVTHIQFPTLCAAYSFPSSISLISCISSVLIKKGKPPPPQQRRRKIKSPWS